VNRAPPRGPLAVHRFTVIGAMALAGLLAGFGSWVMFANLSGAIIADGRLAQDRESLVVQHLNGGLVQSVSVREGDRVAVNAPLLQLDDRELQTELTVISNRLYEIMARRSRLEAERDDTPAILFAPELMARARTSDTVQLAVAGQTRLFDARRLSWSQEVTALGEQTAQFSIQIGGIDAQLAALSDQKALIDEQLGSQQVLLEKGLVQASSVVALRRELSILRGRSGAFIAQRAAAEAKIAATEVEVLRGKSRRREDAITQLRDLVFRQAELAQQRRALRERLQTLVVRAPADGIVLGLGPIAAKTVIKPAEVLMRIVPLERQFIVTARITPSQVDQLYPDQPVRLVFATIDSANAPEFDGLISQLSPDVLFDAATGVPYYRADISLSGPDAELLSRRSDLFPGMPVQVYIRTGSQPAWAYLARPFMVYFSRAMRES